MSTLLDVSAKGLVEPIDLDLGARQEIRKIYAFPRVQVRVDTQIVGMQSLFEGEISPYEELGAFLENFTLGEPLMFERQFKPLEHIDQGVWELKTRDLRLFGWFYRKDLFVCTSIDDATKVKRLKLYGAYRDEAVRDRENLPIDEPKFIVGDDPNDVISNFSYPSS